MRLRLRQTLRLSVRARVMGFIVFLTVLTLVLPVDHLVEQTRREG